MERTNVRETLAERDDMIRKHLADGVPYRDLEAATGLSVKALEKIRAQGGRKI